MNSFLPEAGPPEYYTYYTLCYLALCTDSSGKHVGDDGKSARYPQLFAEDGDRTAFRQIIDPASLTLSANQRLRFARAMRILGLQPHYHLSELQVLISPIKDDSLLKICACFKKDCPCPKDLSMWDKSNLLDEYLAGKNKGQYCPSSLSKGQAILSCFAEQFW